KKIVFITPGVETGGAEKQLALLAKGLSQNGFVPLIIALSLPEGRQRLSDFDCLQVVEINCRKLSQRASAIWKIRRLVKDHDPEIIQGWMYAGNIMASIIGAGTDAQVYHSLRASNMDAKRYGRMIKLNAFLSGYADGVIANSQAGADYHISCGFAPNNMLIIPNGIDTEKFFPDKKSGTIMRRELGVTGDVPLVLYAARVDPMKGHQTVISVAKLCPDIQFIFAGKGTEILDVPKNVLSLGVCDDMHKIYNACDWVLSISKFGEGFPNVIGEAMACGIPVCANDVGDSWRIMGDQGHRLKTVSPEGVAEELGKLFKSNSTIISMMLPLKLIRVNGV
ncbi:MAG: glycosyltransferase, partial [Pseudomonadota bacterium]|nr:glycosyltransferase [Pseudomonadota bacterium]